MDIKTRFLKYVQIDTESNDDNVGTIPSTQEQWNLAKLLAEELQEMGVEDVHVSENCTVYAHLNATPGYEAAPAFGCIAHMDTVKPGKNVRPQVIENYDGEDIRLANGVWIRGSENPELPSLKGRTLIVTDGNTVLGADDKAGVAAIMQMCERLMTEELPHGKVCVAFTPDEEIGQGVDLFSLEEFQADYAVTVDGGEEQVIEYENFNAASAKVEAAGVAAHPGSAKGIMVNAAAALCEFHSMLPPSAVPERTEGREGFIHLIGLQGDVASAEASYILRDFSQERLEYMKQLMEQSCDMLNERYGKEVISVKIKDNYQNMAEVVKKQPQILENLETAIRRAGMEPEYLPIRGGTDGCRISFMGLPCPNIGAGGYGFHGVHEHCTVEGMEACTQVLLELVKLYSEA